MNKVNRYYTMVFLLLVMVFAGALGTSASAAAPKLSAKKITLEPGKRTTLKVKHVKGKIKWKIKWSSSNKKVAVVNKKGRITARKKGTAVIVAQIGKKKLKCRVTVKELAVKRIRLSNHTITFTDSHTSFKLAPNIYPVEAAAKKLKWYSTDLRVATVDQEGVVRPVGNGNCLVYVSVKDNPKKKAACTVCVNLGRQEKEQGETPNETNEIKKVASIELDKQALSIDISSTIYVSNAISATVLPLDASNQELTWQSSDPKVLDVTCNGPNNSIASLNVLQSKLGDYTITAMANDGSGVAAQCKVNLNIDGHTSHIWDTVYCEQVSVATCASPEMVKQKCKVGGCTATRIVSRGDINPDAHSFERVDESRWQCTECKQYLSINKLKFEVMNHSQFIALPEGCTDKEKVTLTGPLKYIITSHEVLRTEYDENSIYKSSECVRIESRTYDSEKNGVISPTYTEGTEWVRVKTSAPAVGGGSVYFDIEATNIDYNWIWAHENLGKWVKDNLPPGLSQYEKMVKIAEYVGNLPYYFPTGGSTPNWVQMFIEGVGDCMASRHLVGYLCLEAGIPANPCGSPDDHGMTLVKADGKYYVIVTGFINGRGHSIYDSQEYAINIRDRYGLTDEDFESFNLSRLRYTGWSA